MRLAASELGPPRGTGLPRAEATSEGLREAKGWRVGEGPTWRRWARPRTERVTT